eukprot:2066784-Amphidinium_carterae.1
MGFLRRFMAVAGGHARCHSQRHIYSQQAPVRGVARFSSALQDKKPAATAEQKEEEVRDKPQGIAGKGRDIWLPHDIIPIGSPIFYFALLAIPLLIWYNESLDDKIDEKNARLREERLRRRAERAAAAGRPGERECETAHE